MTIELETPFLFVVPLVEVSEVGEWGEREGERKDREEKSREQDSRESAPRD